MFNYVFHFFFYSLPMVSSIYIIYSCFLPLKEQTGKIRQLLYFLIVILLYTILQRLVLPLAYGPLRVCLLLTEFTFITFLVQLCFQGSLHKRILIYIMFYVIVEIAEFTTMFLYNVEMSNNGTNMFYTSSADAGSISTLLVLGMVVLIKVHRKKKELTLDTRVAFLHMLIAASCILPMLVLMVDRIVKGQMDMIDTVVIAAFLLVLILLYVTFEATDAVYHKNQEYQLQEQRHQLMQDYYQRVETQQNEIRTIKHDLKNQLIALDAYHEKGDDNRTARQIDQLIERLSGHTKYDFSAHAGVNAIVSAKMMKAEKDGIICEFEVKIPADIEIEENDLVIVIGNILDNAIEACRLCSGRRYIRFCCIYYNGTMVISSENSTDGMVSDLQTRKSDTVNHGWGMKSISAVVKKYGGQMEYNFMLHHFSIEITLLEKT